MLDFAVARQHMVDNQIRPSDVTEPRLVRALLNVPRERFVGEGNESFAYSDHEIRISGEGGRERFMLTPVQLARLVYALDPDPAASVLVVGCGTGFSAAVLSYLAASVTALEEDAALAGIAERTIRELGLSNVTVVQGKLPQGHATGAPYDAILVDGAVEMMPEQLAAQLAPGGLLTAIERHGRLSRAMLYERASGDLAKRALFEAWTSGILPGFQKRPEFVF